MPAAILCLPRITNGPRVAAEPGTVLTFKIDGKTLKVAAQKKKRSPFEEAYGCLKGAFGGISTDELIREMRGC